MNELTKSELINLLFKVSVKAIHELCNGSEDPLFIQESIEYYSRTRPILESVQIMNVDNISDSEKEIKFILSPNYLEKHRYIALTNFLNELKWIFKLPNYESDYEHDYEDEEGAVSWLSRGQVEIISINSETLQMDLATFQSTV